jgi:hypothetical protein
MHRCCSEMELGDRPDPFRCPHNHRQGKLVKLITLKSLLLPTALEQLNPQTSYRFCESSSCPVVYFSAEGQTFTTEDIKVPVFQKNEGDNVPFVTVLAGHANEFKRLLAIQIGQ